MVLNIFKIISGLLFLLTCVNLGACASTATPGSQQRKSKLIETVIDSNNQIIGTVDWSKGRITSYGSGHMRTPAPHTVNHGRRYAINDVHHTMHDVISQVQLDINNKAEIMLHYAAVSRSINQRIKQATILEKKLLRNNHYHITAELSIAGSNGIIQHFIPRYLSHATDLPKPVFKTEWDKHNQADIWPDNYTGVIIDARGVKFRPALFPIISDETGNVIYSINNVEPNSAIYMLFGYANSILSARLNSRAGSTPLILTAHPSSDTPSAKIILKQTEVDRLLAADVRGRFLHRARVVVVLDE